MSALKILCENDSMFWEKWHELLDQQSFCSPFYSKTAQKFFRQSYIDSGLNISSHSLLLMEGDEPRCGIMGFSSTNIGNLQMPVDVESTFIETPNFVITKSTLSELKNSFNQILYGSAGLIKIKDHLIGGELNWASRELCASGVKPITEFARVIDLDAPLDFLWQGIRKSIKHGINRSKRELNIEIISSVNCNLEKLEEFRQLHKLASGRETRSVDSWSKQLQMLKEDRAFMIRGLLDEKLVTACYFTINKNNVYYQSAASLRELFGKPLSHALIWEAMKFSKSKKLKWFEIDHQPYVFGESDNKAEQIAFFKGAFGGEIRPYLVFEREHLKI